MKKVLSVIMIVLCSYAANAGSNPTTEMVYINYYETIKMNVSKTGNYYLVVDDKKVIVGKDTGEWLPCGAQVFVYGVKKRYYCYIKNGKKILLAIRNNKLMVSKL